MGNHKKSVCLIFMTFNLASIGNTLEAAEPKGEVDRVIFKEIEEKLGSSGSPRYPLID